MRISDWSSDVCSSDLTSKIALIGNYLPRKCGIATFTTDTRNGLIERFPAVDVDVYAMEDLGERRDYPPEVAGVIRQNEISDYFAAAQQIGRASCRERVCQYV